LKLNALPLLAVVFLVPNHISYFLAMYKTRQIQMRNISLPRLIFVQKRFLILVRTLNYVVLVEQLTYSEH
jgi:hypothetical protein